MLNYKISLSRFLVGFILIANIKFFSVPGSYAILGSICNYYSKLLVCLAIALFFVAEHIIITKNKYTQVVIAFLLLIGATIIYTVINYPNQSFFLILKKYYYFGAVWFAVPLMSFLKRNNNLQWFFKFIALIGLIYSVYVILVKIVFNFTGVLLIDTNMQYIQMRGGSLRLARTSTFISVSTIIALSNYIKEFKNQKKFFSINFLSFVFGLISIFWVGMTRISELAVVVSGGIIIILSFKKYMKVLVSVFLVVCLPIIYQTIMDFYYSFYSKETVLGTEVRTEGYSYFLSHMFDGKIFGMGLVTSERYHSLLYGAEGRFILSDLGYIGYIGIFGICGIVFLLYLFRTVMKTIKKTYQNQLLPQYPEVIGYLLFFGISGISLAFTDAQRCLYLPIMIILYWIIDEIVLTDKNTIKRGITKQ